VRLLLTHGGQNCAHAARERNVTLSATDERNVTLSVKIAPRIAAFAPSEESR
jgi:hypothetical protein